MSNNNRGPRVLPQTFSLGILEVTITPLADEWDKSGIRVYLASDRDVLFEPDYSNGVNKGPSTADKLLAVLKRGLSESRMTVLEKGDSQEKGNPANRQLQVRDFESYKPESSGAVIRAEKGFYAGEFHAGAMVKVAGEMLTKLSAYLKGAVTSEAVEERINQLYEAVDVCDQPLDSALAPHGKTAPSAGDVAEILRTAISRAIPDKFIPADKTMDGVARDIVGRLVDKNGAVQDADADAVRRAVLTALDENNVAADTGKPASIRALLADEIDKVVTRAASGGIAARAR